MGDKYSMQPVTLRDAMVHSLNVVTVDVAMEVTIGRVMNLAAKAGLPRVAHAYPAMALGTSEATPLQIASAYTAFAANGTRTTPVAIDRVTTGKGITIAQPTAQKNEVLRPEIAYVMSSFMKDVVNRGTGAPIRARGFKFNVAGKTGTSRDGWFGGFTPNLVCVVWVGFDDGEELNLTGAESALPAWVEFVRRAVELRPELGGQSFERPASITTVEIDPDTGLLAAPSCPQRERVSLAPAFLPDHECSLHGDPWGLQSLADAATDAQTPTVQTESQSAAAYASFREATRAIYSTHTPARAPSVEAFDESATTVEEVKRPTRVVVGRDGRRTLTNDLRVVQKGTGVWRD